MNGTVFLPTKCAGCARRGELWCRSCRRALQAAPPPASLDPLYRAAFRYDGVVRSAILAAKYRNRRGALSALATATVRRCGPPPSVDVVTWAPTAAHRARGRGFDQAELIARRVARELGVPCRRLLGRQRGPAQTGRSRAERVRGPEFVARLRSGQRRILLVDDVVTTGATLAAAAHALRQAGAFHVLCWAVAATPNHHGA